MAIRAGRSPEVPCYSPSPSALFEPLEGRLLLANAAPVFSTALWDTYFIPEAKDSGGNYVLDAGLRTFTANTIGIDGQDIDGDALTITAVSDNPNVTAYIPAGNRYARLHFVASNGTTVIGDVVVQLFDADGRAPLAADRFITLATKHVNDNGTTVDPTSLLKPFYTNVKVHRVIPGFMIQTGDAVSGNGTGGSPLGDFNDPDPWPDLSFAGPGVLAMANSGPNTNDCQFFITDGSYAFGNNSYEIFGQVISGQNFVKQITNLPRNGSDRPNNPPILQNVEIFTSTQDATVTLTAADGFAGVAHVTVKLDDGHGGVTQKVITVRPLADLGPSLPTITTDAVTTMTAGVSKVIAPVYHDDGTMPLTYTAQSDNSLVTASVDPATGQVTLNAPASFSGIIQYEITAIEAVGSFDRTPTSFTGTVYVHSPTEVPFYSSTLGAYTGTSLNAMGGFGVGNTFYVANNSKGLARYDLTDPAHPVKLADVTADFVGAKQVQVVGTTAFVVDGSNGFRAFDVSDPTKFTSLGAKVATGGAALGFAISGTTAWIADGSNGITAIDIANPAAMTKIGSFKTWGSFSAGYFASVAVNGNTLYVTDNFGYVVILDISHRTAPKLLGGFSAGYGVWGIHTYGRAGLIVAGGGLLRLWNVGDPKRPDLFSQVAIPGAKQIEVRGNLVVVSGTSSFSFVDLTRPETPRVEYSYASPVQGGQATFVGANVVLPMGAMGFSVIAAARTITDKGTIVFPVGGVSTTVSLAGGGTAHVITTDAGGGAIAGIDVVGGTQKTALTIRTAGGHAITAGDITVTGSLKSLSASSMDLQGNLSVTGSLETLKLHSASGGHTFTIAATDPSTNPAAALTASLAFVSDLAIDSEIPIASLTVGTWSSLLPAPDTIAAPSLGRLTVRQVQTDLSMPGVALERFSSARPLVRVTNTGGTPYLIAVGVGGVLYDITFASLVHWPATALTYALAPTSAEVIAALALKGIHV